MIILYDQWGLIDIETLGQAWLLILPIVGLVLLIAWLTRKR